jgi:hypothetical protein
VRYNETFAEDVVFELTTGNAYIRLHACDIRFGKQSLVLCGQRT